MPLPGLDDEGNLVPLESQDTFTRQMTEAREHARQLPDEHLEMPLQIEAMPVLGTAAGIVRNRLDYLARQRIEAGRPEAGDFDAVAMQEERARREQQQSFGRNVAHGLARGVGIAGEMALAAPVLAAGGGVGAGVGSVLGNTGRVVGGAVGTGAAIAAAVPGGGFYERAAAGEPLGRAFGAATTQGAILGSIGRVVGRFVPGQGLARAAGQAAAGSVIGPFEQGVADFASHAAGLQAHRGTFGDLLEGKWGEAGRELAQQAIVFGFFAGMHRPEERRPAPEPPRTEPLEQARSLATIPPQPEERRPAPEPPRTEPLEQARSLATIPPQAGPPQTPAAGPNAAAGIHPAEAGPAPAGGRGEGFSWGKRARPDNVLEAFQGALRDLNRSGLSMQQASAQLVGLGRKLHAAMSSNPGFTREQANVLVDNYSPVPAMRRFGRALAQNLPLALLENRQRALEPPGRESGKIILTPPPHPDDVRGAPNRLSRNEMMDLFHSVLGEQEPSEPQRLSPEPFAAAPAEAPPGQRDWFARPAENPPEPPGPPPASAAEPTQGTSAQQAPGAPEANPEAPARMSATELHDRLARGEPVEGLSARQRVDLHAHIVEGKTLEEIGRARGVTREAVRRSIEKSLEKLHGKVEEPGASHVAEAPEAEKVVAPPGELRQRNVNQEQHEELANRLNDYIAELARAGKQPSTADLAAIARALRALGESQGSRLRRAVTEASALLGRLEASRAGAAAQAPADPLAAVKERLRPLAEPRPSKAEQAEAIKAAGLKGKAAKEAQAKFDALEQAHNQAAQIRDRPMPGAEHGDAASRFLADEGGHLDLDKLEQWARSGRAKIGEAWEKLRASVTGSVAFVPEAARAAGILREHNAARAQRADRDGIALEKLRRWSYEHMDAEKDPEVRKRRFLDFFGNLERGNLAGVPGELKPYAEVYRRLKDEYTAQLKEHGALKGETIEDHVSRMWRDPKKPDATPEEILRTLTGRRPLAGKEGFRKARTLPSFEEGMKRGLEPVTWNLGEYAVREFDQYSRSLFARQAFNESRAAGLTTFVKVGSRAPSGWAQVNDKLWTKIEPRRRNADGTRGQPVIVGHYYMPEPVAKLFNNHLMPGLSQYGAFRAFRGAGGQMSQLVLGWSGFHATSTTLNAQFTAMAEALRLGSQGRFEEAGARLPEALVPLLAGIKGYQRGKALRAEWDRPGTGTPEIQEMVQHLKEAGARARGGSEYLGNQAEAVRKVFEQWKADKNLKNSGLLLWHALPALNQLVSRPLMEHYVPSIKLSAAADAFRAELARDPHMSLEQRRQLFGHVWDRIEDRFGLLTYDNLFLNRVVRDGLQAGMLSAGWNLGTARAVLGGVKEIASPAHFQGLKEGEGLGRQAAFLISMIAGSGIYGALYQLARTGEAPQETRDLFFPRTGETRNGHPERVSLPTYMNDLASVLNRPTDSPLQVPQNLYHLAAGKLHPLIRIAGELLTNRDFRDTAIADPNDPWSRQAYDQGRHALAALVPVGIGQAVEAHGRQAPLAEQVQGFAGVRRAPYRLSHSAEEQRAVETGRRSEPTPFERRRRSLLR